MDSSGLFGFPLSAIAPELDEKLNTGIAAMSFARERSSCSVADQLWSSWRCSYPLSHAFVVIERVPGEALPLIWDKLVDSVCRRVGRGYGCGKRNTNMYIKFYRYLSYQYSIHTNWGADLREVYGKGS